MKNIKTSHGIAIFGACLLVSLLFINWASRRTDLVSIPSSTQTANISGAGSGLVANYSMDDSVNDSAGSNTGSPVSATFSTGKIGKSIVLDGTNSYAEAPASSALNISGSQITLSAWVNVQNTGTPQIILAKPASGSSHVSPYFSYSLHLLEDKTPRFWLALGGSGTSVA